MKISVLFPVFIALVDEANGDTHADFYVELISFKKSHRVTHPYEHE